jgi:hypothetical protein
MDKVMCNCCEEMHHEDEVTTFCDHCLEAGACDCCTCEEE